MELVGVTIGQLITDSLPTTDKNGTQMTPIGR
jgi:hypothetical protein